MTRRVWKAVSAPPGVLNWFGRTAPTSEVRGRWPKSPGSRSPRRGGSDDGGADEESRDLDHSLFLAYPRPRELNPKAPREIERMIYLTLCDEAYGLPDFRMDLEDFLLKS